ncbi:META domain-containing protein [Pontixanthobacter aestiaquae]|uniref:META domain-containing protein n=1 Tax=Pontixanthobacter aestiaquae TaxID=1509367 RepID=A0A844Z6T9_9SPHN|nr:META domain-containing protein [Pontixanthobacter aestiaquae]MDN3645965.1 META domain-containing protein [Pontixanthobacter aestiaquae]MXO83042.1 META domain-containing protein [Pontixanthobacter aestiaquae]
MTINPESYSISIASLGIDKTGKVPAGQAFDSDRQVYRMDGLTIEFLGGHCTDSMSGDRYFHSIRVDVNGRKLIGCGGVKLPPADLEGSAWRGQKQLPAFRDMIPRQFDGTLRFANGTVSGTTGCNRFSAEYRVEGSLLYVGPLAMTKMRCQGLTGKFEQRFLELFSQPTNIVFSPSGALIIDRPDILGLSFDPAN